MRRLLAALVVTLALPAAARAEDLAQYVDPTIGTLAPGFVFPGADVPFGMVQNSPDTFTPAGYDDPIGPYSGYMGHHPQIRDFSLVHLSGPGVAKAGDLPFMPWVGAAGQTPPSDPMQYATPFTHATEQASAGYYAVTLANGIKAELTAATHAAMQRYSFPPAAGAYLIVDPHHHNDGSTQDGGFDVDPLDPHVITGFTQTDHYPVYFAARFSEPVTGHGDHWVSFAPGSAVTMRVGISFVDLEGAQRNLAADAPAGLSFEEMRAAAYAAWDRELHKIEVGGGTIADKRTFYTALYHALLHPNVFTDTDDRYRGFDDQVHTAEGRTQYANFSSWDTYKATNQLQALLEPERYADMLRSLLADAQVPGGYLPRWAEQSYDAAHMSGDPAIPMIADGYCRGLIGGDDAQALYEQAVALVGRRQAEWQQLGYLPIDKGYDSGTGTTLEYGVADFALALMAHRLGLEDDAQRWLEQSLNYRKVLDPDTRWIRPRNADGTWYANFDPAHDETGFQEGNSWQYSWLVPQDPRGLFDGMGGDAAAVDRLDHLFTAPAELQNRLTAYGILYRFDQWAPGNEHDLGAPYLYPFARQPWKTAAELAAARQVWRPTVDGIPGNDDLGGLSAWYVWNALGFGPFTPGAPLYMVGSPLFTSATIALNPQQHFTIDAPAASPVAKYVQGGTLDGKPLDRAWFQDSAIRPGGTLHLDMGATPNTGWASDARDVPPSASDAPLSAFGCDA